jgi:hypothetical protein
MTEKLLTEPLLFITGLDPLIATWRGADSTTKVTVVHLVRRGSFIGSVRRPIAVRSCRLFDQSLNRTTTG